MNYAVIKSGGKQHKVEEGEIISIEKLNAEEGDKVEFEEVLAIKSEGKLQVGSPVIDGAKVIATVTQLDNLKNPLSQSSLSPDSFFFGPIQINTL